VSDKISTITDTIRQDIVSGRLRPYSALPNRRALAEEHKTTVDTIAIVLRNLEIEGLIVKGRGSTMKVNTSRERITTNDETFRDVMAKAGHTVKIEHLATPSIIEASPEIAHEFHVPVRTPMIERKRREIVDGVVYRYSRKIYLAELISKEHLEAMQADYTYNIREVIEQQRPLSRIAERILARVITEKDEAEILGTIPGAPVLEHWKINYDEYKRILYISIIVHNAAYFVRQFDYHPSEEPRSSFILVENG
jgi:DNA-binding GntR family transcriptional regulator